MYKFNIKTTLIRNFWIILVAILIISSHWLWFFSDAPLTSGDWSYIHKNQINDWLPLPIIWSVDNLGGLNPFFANSLIEVPFRWLTSEFSFGLAERAIYLIPTILISIYAISKLCEYFSLSSIAKSIAIVVYLCSTPLIIIRTGHNTLAMAYSIAPLVIYTFSKSLQTSRASYLVLTSILSFVMAAYEPRAYYLLFFILIIQFAFLVFARTEKLHVHSVVAKTFILFIIVASTGLLFSYWIMPLVFSGGSVASNILGRPLFGAGFSSIMRSLTLHHAFWSGGTYTPFVIQPISPYFVLAPIVLIVTFLISPKNMKLMPFKLLLLVGLFLGKQENAPFGFIYQFLYLYFPGFSAFREASKFYFYTTLASSILLAYLFEKMIGVKRHLLTRNKVVSMMFWLLFISLLVSYLYNLKPLVTGDIKTLFLPRSMPNDYKVLNEYLLKNASDSRVMGVPTSSRWTVKSDRFPSISYYTIFDSIPGTIKYRNLAFTLGLIQHLETNDFTRYLDENSVRFIVVPLQDTENDDNFFEYFDNNRTGFLAKLDQTKLKRVDLGMKEVVLYENVDSKPRVTVKGDKSIQQNITTKFVNAAQYVIRLHNVSGKILITYRENFHPGWKLYEYEPPSLISFIGQKSLDAKHKSNLLQQNEYELDIADYCNKNSNKCDRNEYGYILDLQIEFEPQKYVIIGFGISALTLFLLVGGMIIVNRLQHSGNAMKE